MDSLTTQKSNQSLAEYLWSHYSEHVLEYYKQKQELVNDKNIHDFLIAVISTAFFALLIKGFNISFAYAAIIDLTFLLFAFFGYQVFDRFVLRFFQQDALKFIIQELADRVAYYENKLEDEERQQYLSSLSNTDEMRLVLKSYRSPDGIDCERSYIRFDSIDAMPPDEVQKEYTRFLGSLLEDWDTYRSKIRKLDQEIEILELYQKR